MGVTMLNIRNRWRALKAVHKGVDTFVATDGSLRLARNMGKEKTLTISAEHLPLLEDKPK